MAAKFLSFPLDVSACGQSLGVTKSECHSSPFFSLSIQTSFFLFSLFFFPAKQTSTVEQNFVSFSICKFGVSTLPLEFPFLSFRYSLVFLEFPFGIRFLFLEKFSFTFFFFLSQDLFNLIFLTILPTKQTRASLVLECPGHLFCFSRVKFLSLESSHSRRPE